MGSANLALVFGPTLTRAPPTVDARQLHNDVPAINILIQLCIERHEHIFGTEEEEEEEGEGAPCDPATTNESPMLMLKEALHQYDPGDDGDDVLLSTSPPSDPPSAPPSTTPEAGATQVYTPHTQKSKSVEGAMKLKFASFCFS